MGLSQDDMNELKQELEKEIKDLAAFNTRLIGFKFMSPTDNKPPRVKLTDKHFDKSVILSLCSGHSLKEAAIRYLIKRGFDVQGANSAHGVIIIRNFNPTNQIK